MVSKTSSLKDSSGSPSSSEFQSIHRPAVEEPVLNVTVPLGSMPMKKSSPSTVAPLSSGTTRQYNVEAVPKPLERCTVKLKLLPMPPLVPSASSGRNRR